MLHLSFPLSGYLDSIRRSGLQNELWCLSICLYTHIFLKYILVYEFLEIQKRESLKISKPFHITKKKGNHQGLKVKNAW